MAHSSADTTLGGFILPLVVLLSLVVLTLVADWYRQVTVQSYLAERVIERKALLLECKSLMPYLKRRLATLTATELVREQPDYLVIQEGTSTRLKVDRSAWADNRISFSFHFPADGKLDGTVLTTYYATK